MSSGRLPPKKRTSEDEAEFSQRHKARKSSSEPEPSTSDCDRFCPPRAGIVKRVHMKNFMCHDSLEIKFNSCINFIIGRNGSGKSAIMTAIIVGLGGKASTTNRGTSLKDFIKKGRNSATIEIVLNNIGPNSYKHKEFGDELIIVRTLTSSSSSIYKIKSTNGSVLSTKKEDLARILSTFNIQIDNPVSILNQDTARNFLNSSDPGDLYKLFMKATQLQQIENDYRAANEQRKKIQTILVDRKEYSKIATEEVRKLQKKWNAHQNLESIREKKVTLENEYFWALVMEAEKKLLQLQNDCNDHHKKEEEIRGKVEAMSKKKEQLEDQQREIRNQLREMQTHIIDVEKNVMAAKDDVKRTRDEYSRKMQECTKIETKLKRQRSDIKRLKDEIIRIQNMSGPESVARRRKINEKKNELEQEAESVNANLKSAEHHKDQIRAALDHYKEQQDVLRSEETERKYELDNLRRKIQSLRSQENDVLSVYGDWVPTLVKNMHELHRRGGFRKLPRGPVGAYVKLHDATWAPSIEGILSGQLLAFCVDNKADQDVLKNLMSQVIGHGRKPPIINSPFIEQVHDVRKFAVQSDQYYSVLDMLIIEDSVVANCLIDQLGIECVLLIPTSEEAYEIMSQSTRVPKNCSRAVTKNGDLFYPDPNYRSYAGGRNRAKYLQVSMEEAIRNAEEQMAEVERKYHSTREQLHSVQRDFDTNKKELDTQHIQCSTLRRRLMAIKYEVQHLETEEPEPASIASLEEELEEYSRQSEATAEEWSNLDISCNELKLAMESAEKKYLSYKSDIKKNRECQQPQQNKIEQIKTSVQTLENRIKYEEQRAENEVRTIKDIEKSMRDQEKVIDARRTDAEKLKVDRIKSRRSAASLKEEITNINKHLHQVAVREGTMEDVGREYSQKRNKLESMQKEITILDAAADKLEQIIDDRKAIYSTIQRITTIRVQVIFQGLLNQRHFTGDLTLDHKNRTLKIKVSSLSGTKKQNENVRTLSGGERSYSTIAFIMALWEAMELPFYMLDEFDVFMDKVNRRVSMDLLISQARDRFGFQFVFLTPLDTSSVHADRRLTIHKLRDPRDQAQEEEDEGE